MSVSFNSNSNYSVTRRIIEQTKKNISQKDPIMSRMDDMFIKGVEKFTGNSAITSTLTNFSKKIPIVGTLMMGAFEVPDLIDGFKNGDGLQQVGRSSIKVATLTGTATAGSALGGAIGTVLFPGVGTVIGGILGGIAGGFIGDSIGGFIGNTLFGKSIKEQKEEQMLSSQNPGIYPYDLNFEYPYDMNFNAHNNPYNTFDGTNSQYNNFNALNFVGDPYLTGQYGGFDPYTNIMSNTINPYIGLNPYDFNVGLPYNRLNQGYGLY